jgi:hypothetical protein
MPDRARLWMARLTLALVALMLPACRRETPAGTPAPGNVEGPARPGFLYEDDFGDSGSGWLEAADVESGQGYRDGRFFIEVRSPDLVVWDNASVNFRDLVLEVEARLVSGPVESSYGVLCRYVDEDNFYRFDLTGDGRYAVFKSQYGEWVTLADWRASEHVGPRGEVNRIKIVCQGPRMRFFVGDEMLVSVEDDAFERGDVGLFASTFAGPGAEVEFDNLRVRETE